jgi:hypothetical protein
MRVTPRYEDEAEEFAEGSEARSLSKELATRVASPKGWCGSQAFVAKRKPRDALQRRAAKDHSAVNLTLLAYHTFDPPGPPQMANLRTTGFAVSGPTFMFLSGIL